MSVEEARHVLTGDHIQPEDGGPTLMVVCTHHSPSQSVITVLTDGSEMLVLEYLPDDPVLVAHYSDAWDEESTNAND
jgi:hypothetical protein